MGSRASRRAKLPGLPQQTDLAYLAGLVDRGGGFVTRPPGLKIRAAPALRSRLLQRFGGTEHSASGTWTLSQTATLTYLLPALSPFVIARQLELEAMIQLLAHHTSRPNYHGDEEWRERREQLRAAVRGPGARPAATAHARPSS